MEGSEGDGAVRSVGRGLPFPQRSSALRSGGTFVCPGTRRRPTRDVQCRVDAGKWDSLDDAAQEPGLLPWKKSRDRLIFEQAGRIVYCERGYSHNGSREVVITVMQLAWHYSLKTVGMPMPRATADRLSICKTVSVSLFFFPHNFQRALRRDRYLEFFFSSHLKGGSILLWSFFPSDRSILECQLSEL